MRKYYNDFNEEEFNEEYERGFRDGRREALLELNKKSLADEIYTDCRNSNVLVDFGVEKKGDTIVVSGIYIKIFITVEDSEIKNIILKSKKNTESFCGTWKKTNFSKLFKEVNKARLEVLKIYDIYSTEIKALAILLREIKDRYL